VLLPDWRKKSGKRATGRVLLVADTISVRALGCDSLWSAAARLEEEEYSNV